MTWRDRLELAVADCVVLLARLRLELAEQRRADTGESVARMVDRSGPPRSLP